MSNYFTPDFLAFFKELAPNNNKDWFDANRSRYVKSIKEPVENFVTDLIAQVQKKDGDVKITAKESIHRINRDIRFSKDKTPYKMYSSALISPEGKKNKSLAGFYFELGPEHVAFYAGIYELDTATLYKVRTYIAKNLKTFHEIVTDKKLVKLFSEIQGDQSARVDKSLKAAAEKQPLIMRRQFYVSAELDPKLAVSKDLMKTTMEYYHAVLPLLLFLRKAVK